ncbi:MAG: hypothetical protein COB67_10505 [SAR324 cluster bacterium]|uniref:Uncharacterized protein n=1 Tax=SAR324 cluster bacterium TaxID=2024889 RepID=A0A2A4SYG3_9DELT|nr:MAG: hypothetical protein COB67_10505 [SAR324 cluster bacterium]
MGSENYFGKTNKRGVENLCYGVVKKVAKYDSILIVCEGEKTEPKYFKEMRHSLHFCDIGLRQSNYLYFKIFTRNRNDY